MDGRLRILLVDDDEVDRAAVKRALRGVSADIHEQESAEGVLERLRSEPFDCVILDCALPGEDGLSLVRRIREAGLNTPVLVVTGQEEDIAADLVNAGATDYLSKTDVNPRQMESRLRYALRVGQAEERARVAAQQLAAERQLLAQVIRQLPAAVFIADAAGKVLYANDLARALCGDLDSTAGLGSCRARWCGGRWLTPDDWPLVAALRDDCTVSGVELEVLRRDDTVVFCRASAAPVRGATGDIVAAVMILDDWSEERQVKEQLAHAAHLREEVLAVVSHDLRNPIHAIGVAIDELADPSLEDTDRKNYVAAVRRTLKRADRLIEDLLDASRIDAGGLVLHPQPATVKGIVEQAVRDHEMLAGEAGMTIHVHTNDNGLRVMVDRERILQVMGNLIGNALRHARGMGAVDIDVAKEDGVVWISVGDRGPGIEAEALPHVFDRFYQAGAQRRAGAGLGLAIARGIVRAHGGCVEARNRAGGGAEFRFCLPVEGS